MMTHDKTLVLIDSLFEQYGLDGIEREGILFLPMLRGRLEGRWVRAIRKLHLSLPLPAKSLWLGQWVGAAEEYPTIILADAGNTPNVVRYIRRRWPQKRVIVWYRNPAASTVAPEAFDRGSCELWSFDPADCGAHQMKYNPQFYIPQDLGPAGPVEQDAFFVGQDKGRGRLLARMEQALTAAGCKTRFCLVGVNSPRLSYQEIVRQVMRSGVVVDCPCQGQSGLTLRPLEALFYRKKLVTTSPGIRQEPFYRPDNVFVWGQDDPETLADFLARPYDASADRCREAYSLKAWVDRFTPENRRNP